MELLSIETTDADLTDVHGSGLTQN